MKSWSVQKRNERADHIARIASEIYDQVGLVHESFEKAYSELEKYSKHLELAKNRLKDGKGSLLSKANKMKESSIIEKGRISQAPIIENEIAMVITRKISNRKKKLREVADNEFGFIVIFFLSLE